MPSRRTVSKGVNRIDQMRDTAGYDGLYKIDEYGNIWSINFAGGSKAKKLKPILSPGGYLYVNIYKNKKHRALRLNRAVALAFIPNPENKPEVNHKDGVKTNNHMDNLEWATHIENQQHRREILGKNTRGENNGMAKLTEIQVREILSQQGLKTQEALGEKYGVSHSIIGRIFRREGWKYI